MSVQKVNKAIRLFNETISLGIEFFFEIERVTLYLDDKYKILPQFEDELKNVDKWN